MFGSEAVPAGLFALLICFVPETPRYLVSIGQDEKALGILSRINGSGKASQILQDIKDTMTVKTEKLLTYGAYAADGSLIMPSPTVNINTTLVDALLTFGWRF